eukprot:c21516_g1_i3.p1 GENE.c21516_g1_i3~~c21516_g1_i3.p1  ORF type:complete len:407 (+),score=145.77 c21516_g1_i3:2299-3519(+)
MSEVNEEGKEKVVVVRKKKVEGGTEKRKPRTTQQIPDEILQNSELNLAISVLPSNYNFEIHKTIWRIQQAKAIRVALQFPEGFLIYSCAIADIIERFASVETIVMGDVTYGACCIDDFTARALGADFIVHYGHSCLVPINVTNVKTLYIFVDILLDVKHLGDTVIQNLSEKYKKIALLGTIQFASSFQSVRPDLEKVFEIFVPQAQPLSPGEVLGCTSPKFDETVDACVFVADGRFHVESVLIHNPKLPVYRYDPFTKRLIHEKYDHQMMHTLRREAIAKASTARKFGIILGTLGRQGNPGVLEHIQYQLEKRSIPYIVVLMSEIFPSKLARFADIDAWIQIACPRLSIDWGHHFSVPLLSPYEAQVAIGEVEWKKDYPMDYYARDGGSWSVYTPKNSLKDLNSLL